MLFTVECFHFLPTSWQYFKVIFQLFSLEGIFGFCLFPLRNSYLLFQSSFYKMWQHFMKPNMQIKKIKKINIWTLQCLMEDIFFLQN